MELLKVARGSGTRGASVGSRISFPSSVSVGETRVAASIRSEPHVNERRIMVGEPAGGPLVARRAAATPVRIGSCAAFSLQTRFASLVLSGVHFLPCRPRLVRCRLSNPALLRGKIRRRAAILPWRGFRSVLRSAMLADIRSLRNVAGTNGIRAFEALQSQRIPRGCDGNSVVALAGSNGCGGPSGVFGILRRGGCRRMRWRSGPESNRIGVRC